MWSQDGGGIGQGDHYLPTNSSKDHLNAEQLSQTASEPWGRTENSRKAAHSL